MQLNSLFSFLGKHSLSPEGDAGAHSGPQQKPTGFGAMLASTLAILSQRGDDASPKGFALGGDAENAPGEETGPIHIGPFTTPDEEVQSADLTAETDAEATNSFSAPLIPTPEPETGQHVTQAGTSDGADEELLRRSASHKLDASATPDDHVSDERLAASRARNSSENTTAPARPDVSEELTADVPKGKNINLTDASAEATSESNDAGSSETSSPQADADLDAPNERGHTTPVKEGDSSRSQEEILARKSRAGDETSGERTASADNRSDDGSKTSSEGRRAADGKAEADAGEDQLGPKPQQTTTVQADEELPRRAGRAESKERVSPPVGERNRPSDASTMEAKFDRPADTEPVDAARPTNDASSATEETSPGLRRADGRDDVRPSAPVKHESRGGNSVASTAESNPNTTSDKPAAGTAAAAAERVRAADLVRASHGISADRIRIWQEKSAGASKTAGSAEATREVTAAAAPPTDDHAIANAAQPNTKSDVIAKQSATTNEAAPKAQTGVALPGPDAPSSAGEVHASETAKSQTAEKSTQPSAGAAEAADAATVQKPGADETRSDRRGGAEADRTESRTTTNAAGRSNSQTSDGDAGRQNDFTSGTEDRIENASDVAAEELSAETTSFETTLEAEAISVDAEIPVDVDTATNENKFTFSPEKAQSTTHASTLTDVEAPARPRQSGSLAWLRSMMSDGLKSFALDEDWKVIEMQLEEGQGTMTVRARRDEEKVSIAVNFTDPQLRALAIENADRLQETLRTQYQANVDLSLMSDGAGQSPQGDRNDVRQARSGISGASNETGSRSTTSVADRARATRAALAGARNEWIG